MTLDLFKQFSSRVANFSLQGPPLSLNSLKRCTLHFCPSFSCHSACSFSFSSVTFFVYSYCCYQEVIFASSPSTDQPLVLPPRSAACPVLTCKAATVVCILGVHNCCLTLKHAKKWPPMTLLVLREMRI